MISLFPRKTFHNRPNGLRPDLAQVIADRKPRFIRFPGGCVAHGDGLDNLYRWKQTIGPVEQRKAQRNPGGSILNGMNVLLRKPGGAPTPHFCAKAGFHGSPVPGPQTPSRLITFGLKVVGKVCNAPSAYRTSAVASAPAGTNSFADLGWWQVFQDPQLTSYIGEALTNNWDMKIAAARVLQAEAALRITRSQYFPSVSAGGDLVTTRGSQTGPAPMPSGMNPQRDYGEVFVGMSAYEVDLWGKIRRANEAARARLFATVDAQRAVRQTLVAAVASTYLGLLELDYPNCRGAVQMIDQ